MKVHQLQDIRSVHFWHINHHLLLLWHINNVILDIQHEGSENSTIVKQLESYSLYKDSKKKDNNVDKEEEEYDKYPCHIGGVQPPSSQPS